MSRGVEAALGRLGLQIDADRRFVDSFRPLTLAHLEQGEGRWVAFAALAIDRFLIAPTAEHGGWVHDYRRFAEVVAHVAVPLRAAHVIAPRRGDDGAPLRAGWVAMGEGHDPASAGQAAETSLRAIESIVRAVLGSRLVVEPVLGRRTLLDLLRPLFAPRVRVVRRVPIGFEGSTAVRLRGGGALTKSASIALPWAAEGQAWLPLVRGLAASPDEAALVVRFDTGLAPQPHRVAELEAMASRAVGAAPRSWSDAVRARLDSLHHGRLAAEVTLTSQGGTDPGLEALALSAFTREVGPQTLATPLELVDREVVAGRASLIEALSLEDDIDRWIGAREAPALMRSCEPPSSELEPLAATRARVHPCGRPPSPDGTKLGLALRRGRWDELRLSEEARFRHVYVVGQTGTGKSTLLSNMIADDLAAGHGVTVLDPHGTLVASILARIPAGREQDVIVIDGADRARAVPLNPWTIHASSAEDYRCRRDVAIEDILDTIDHLYDLRATGGPMFEKYFRTFSLLLLGNQRPRCYVPVLPMMEMAFNHRGLREALLLAIGDDDPLTREAVAALTRQHGEVSLENMAPYVTSKLVRFYGTSRGRRILAQPDALDFDEVVRARRIVLVTLPHAELGLETATLIARQVVLRLSQACMSRPVSADAPAHFLYADEFQTYATPRFATLLSEARKFKLGLVLAHQYVEQLRHGRHGAAVLDAVLGNVGTTVAFRVGIADAERLEASFAPIARAEELAALRNFTALVRVAGDRISPTFTLRTTAASAGDASRAQRIRREALARWARPAKRADAMLSAQLRLLRALDEPPLL